jgi:hypothetical protein
MANHTVPGGGKLYDQFAPRERLVLLLEAMARGDDAETLRLRRSCPRKTYTGPDAAFDDRFALAHDTVAVVCGDLRALVAQLRVLHWAMENSEHFSVLHHIDAEIGLVLSHTGHDLASELRGTWDAFSHFCTSRIGLQPGPVLDACRYPGGEELARWMKAYAHVKPQATTVAGYREALCGLWDRRFGEGAGINE